jgi:hypothetical protein
MKKLQQTSPALTIIDMINDFNFNHAQHDYFLIKSKHSAFYGRDCRKCLRSIFPNGAYIREYCLHIPHDCTASNDEHDNQNALKVMEKILKADRSSFTKTIITFLLCFLHKMVTVYSAYYLLIRDSAAKACN